MARSMSRAIDWWTSKAEQRPPIVYLEAARNQQLRITGLLIALRIGGMTYAKASSGDHNYISWDISAALSNCEVP